VYLLAAGERAAVTAKARVFRGRLLAPEDYSRILAMESVGEVATYLTRTEAYGRYITGPSPETIHRVDLEAIITTIPLLEEIPFCRYLGPERAALLRAWGERFDVDLVRRVLNIITAGAGSREGLRRRIASVPITVADGEKLLAAKTLRDVLEAMKGYPIYDVLEEPLKRAEKQGGSLFRVKMALDSFFMTNILSGGRKLPGSEGRGVRHIFGIRADLINLYWIYRGRRFFSMSPEEALGLTLPVRYRLKFDGLSEIAFAPDIPSMIKLLREGPYGEAFGELGEDAAEVDEMALEHNLYRILFKISEAVFRSGASGVHAVLAYLTLRELEVKDLFTIIECVRYGYDRDKTREFLIHPSRLSAAGREGRSQWPS
jgi:V/A-type H+-transporting ATPase subunit C